MNTRSREVRPRLTKQDLETLATLVKGVRTGLVPTANSIEEFNKLGCVRTFMRKWGDEEALFATHARKYLHALRPDSGVAFHETDRYAKLPKSATARQTPSPSPPAVGTSKAQSASIEVAVFATRSFKRGDTIKLKGGVANLTEDEDDALRASGGKQDFSVLHSARKGCFSLLLGPARFVNHDCRNNVEFRLTGNHMTFKVVEDIEANEQLFTHYGTNLGPVCALDAWSHIWVRLACARSHFSTNHVCSFRLKRGAYSIATKQVKLAPPPIPVPASRKRATSPTRRSARTSGAGLGHELTAQRSLSRSTSRSSSLSSLSSSSRDSSPSGSSDSHDKRRSGRTAVVIDDFRTRKRLVHPPLRPPPGYAADYEWNPRKQTATYKGLTALPIEARPPKRKREASFDADEENFQRGREGGLPSSASKIRGGPFDPFGDEIGGGKKRKLGKKKQPQKVCKLGERTSSRNPKAVFSRLEALLGVCGESDSDLSELEEDDEVDAESDLTELSEDDEELKVASLVEDGKVEVTEADVDKVPPTPEEQGNDAEIAHLPNRAIAAPNFDEGEESDLTQLSATEAENEDEDLDRASDKVAGASAEDHVMQEAVSYSEEDLEAGESNGDLGEDDADDEGDFRNRKLASPVAASRNARSPSLDFHIAPRTLASTVVPDDSTATPLLIAVPASSDATSGSTSFLAEASAAALVNMPREPATPISLPNSSSSTFEDDFDPDDEDVLDDIVLVGAPAVTRHSSGPTAELVDGVDHDPEQHAQDLATFPEATSTGAEEGSRDSKADPPPPSLMNGTGGGNGGDDEKDGRKPAEIGHGALDVEMEVEEEEKPEVEREDEPQDEPEAMSLIEVQGRLGLDAFDFPMDGAAPSEAEDFHNESEREAANFLLMMGTRDPPPPLMEPPYHELPATSIGPYGPPPDRIAPSPPKTSSASETSTGSSSRTLEQGFIVVQQKKRKTKRPSEGPEGKVAVAPQRSTRRKSLLSPSPPPMSRSKATQPPKKAVKAEARVEVDLTNRPSAPRVSSAPGPVAAQDRKRGRTSDLSGQAAKAQGSLRSASSASPHATTSRDSSREPRSTRLSQPIAGNLNDLLASPLVTSVAGGYDPATKRYVTTASGKKMAKSPSPEPLELPGPRSGRETRRSCPIGVDIKDLLASPTVAGVSGGYDPIRKRYTGKQRARGLQTGEVASGESGSEAT
ncbi:[histone H4]-N-methyl-L-lysine20 N-methyltransferase, partial [Phenoliferia sp. Uapishka_3]